ncbi:hypothetical protein M011DRAFT_472627 [Sporormia fimetaria CBS 119925]|uniref:Uncharacterized protein n=1 Tax=Sporormia fimetaria CBS 119925 TaxID=1340428 RepID=A0A6A6UWW0_9PLEO|nr:hypothetical protein M011DRAFT_472627 [Sporormia fimetaria CBS 119925]
MALTNLLIAFPIAAPALYIAYQHISLAAKVQCRTTPYLQTSTLSVPNEVQQNPERYIIHHERACKTIARTQIDGVTRAEALTLFLRHTMSTFSHLPPAWGIWYMLKDARDRKTFDEKYIQCLGFEKGDRVCGVYVVELRNGGRAVLRLDAPKSYSGPRVEGMLVVGMEDEEAGEMVRFVNHTVLWREKGGGSKSVLEGKVGRYVHGLMVRRLMETAVGRLIKDSKSQCMQ